VSSALIGYSGFVGSTLLRQTRFDALYRSTNIAESAGKEFDLVVCAGAPAQKWMANREPEVDRQRIDSLVGALRNIRCSMFVLISTVDVFVSPVAVDEDTLPAEPGLTAYGLNRLRLEKFVASRFPDHLIVRLPGLVGPGLRKNVVYDLHNDNRLDAVDSRGVFQFYPMVNLWYDIKKAREVDLNLIHLTAAPVSVAEIAAEGFGRSFDNTLVGSPASYDMRTGHAALFGGQDVYQYDVRDTLQAIRAYAQSEPRSDSDKSGVS
jgi:dTDP-4-dehydrorhamnose reductase